jgi:hypothetical protein
MAYIPPADTVFTDHAMFMVIGEEPNMPFSATWTEITHHMVVKIVHALHNSSDLNPMSAHECSSRGIV